LIEVGEEPRWPRRLLAGHWINVEGPVNVRVGDLGRAPIPEVQIRTDLIVPQGIPGPPCFLRLQKRDTLQA